MSEAHYDSGLTKNYDEPICEGDGVVVYEDDGIKGMYVAYEVSNGDLGREIAWFKDNLDDAYEFCLNWGLEEI
jgi:hypothetical protein